MQRVFLYVVIGLLVFVSACVPLSDTTSSPSPSAESSASPTSYGSASPTSTSKASASIKPTPSPTPKKTAIPSPTTTGATTNPTAIPTSTPTPTRTPTPAPTVTSNSGTITVTPSSITATVDRSQSVGGEIPLPSYVITSQGATAFNIVKTNQNAPFSTTLGGGGLQPGDSRTASVKLAEVSVANGTYTQTFLVQYTKNGITYSGPTVTYTVTLTGNSPASQLSVNTTSINETISRATAQTGTVLNGTGFSITSSGADSFYIDVHRASNDQFNHMNFHPIGENISNGETKWIRPKINIGVANGTYSSYVLVRYFKNSLTIENPITVNYSITITD